jgi:hypothetical protein
LAAIGQDREGLAEWASEIAEKEKEAKERLRQVVLDRCKDTLWERETNGGGAVPSSRPPLDKVDRPAPLDSLSAWRRYKVRPHPSPYQTPCLRGAATR